MPNSPKHEVEPSNAVLAAQIEALKEKVDTLVTRVEFTPVKILVYGGAGTILSTVVGALLAKVILKQ